MSAFDVRTAAFDELDSRTAYLLWQLRESVFVVEQRCAYADLDGRDLEPGTVHAWASAVTGETIGYVRLLDDGDHARIGRVLVSRSHRGQGIADELMGTTLRLVGARASVLDAQSHLAVWYVRLGYRPTGPEFLDDGIPHVPMRREAR